jgi:hypothetical protein
MLDLIRSLEHDNLFANLILENMVNHLLCIKMFELNWEGLERVTFWNIVFDTCLELIVCEG